MNFSFEGNYKPKRNINLGGIKKVEDKKSLMLKAQAERKARELERQKLKSAQHIQVKKNPVFFFHTDICLIRRFIEVAKQLT
jgi:hypothetical protein